MTGPAAPGSDGPDHASLMSPLARGHAFAALEGREVATDGADLAMEMEVTPRVVNGAGVLQGALPATLADMVAGSLLLRGGEPGRLDTTSEGVVFDVPYILFVVLLIVGWHPYMVAIADGASSAKEVGRVERR